SCGRKLQCAKRAASASGCRKSCGQRQLLNRKSAWSTIRSCRYWTACCARRLKCKMKSTTTEAKPLKRQNGREVRWGCREKITTEDVWQALGIKPAQRTQLHNENMGDAMRALGFTKTRLRVDGSLGYVYVRGSEPYRRILVTPGTDGLPASARYEDD